ncbi:hypothetical protein Sgly_1280 [Syntrophobotulus glycolicus DSM 8271]|uniref:Uncharacterized protein n=2 Tax=Syntrophobotulus TaxID=51196 RepID=F0SV92_SYNGF|nr:hypothetical protein Sgly_1280 [Syntrophobotulus glycolicus DSM 8271]
MTLTFTLQMNLTMTTTLSPYDCGELLMPPTAFREADMRLHGLSLIRIGLCVPQEFQEYCVYHPPLKLLASRAN